MSPPSDLGQVGQLVHERDAGREHGVGRVLGQFGRAPRHHQHAVVVALEGRVELAHHAARRAASSVPRMMRSGFWKSSTAAPSFRNSGLETTANSTLAPRAASVSRDRLLDQVAGAHRHRALVDDDDIALQVLADGPGRGQHVRQVGRAVLVGRRAHRDHQHFAVGRAFGGRGGEATAASRPRCAGRRPRGRARGWGSRPGSGGRPCAGRGRRRAPRGPHPPGRRR